MLLVLIVALTLTASVGAEDDSSVCVTVDVSADVPSSAIFVDGFELGDISLWLDPVPAYPATGILDVIFEVGVDGVLSGDHLLELRVLTPNGHLYQVLTAPVTADAAKTTSRVRVAGFPYPLQVQHLKPITVAKASASGVVLKLPVGGTLIVSTSLYGLWEVQPFLDRAAAGCAGPIRFQLIQ